MVQLSSKWLHQLWIDGGGSSAFNLVGQHRSGNTLERTLEKKGSQVSGVEILNRNNVLFQSEKGYWWPCLHLGFCLPAKTDLHHVITCLSDAFSVTTCITFHLMVLTAVHMIQGVRLDPDPTTSTLHMRSVLLQPAVDIQPGPHPSVMSEARPVPPCSWFLSFYWLCQSQY